VVLFESDMAGDMLRALAQSYNTFHAGAFLPVGDMSRFVGQTVTQVFSLSLQLAAPFMILGILFQVAAGVMVKMVPQMQIFFVAAPLQILLGLAIFAFMLGTMLSLWLNGFHEGMTNLFTGSDGSI
ncbi:MAG TPA: flagellar biosynthetic protein FliR, partial [Alphaproteobacteria bacterium]|nr:flagellar biosynthetic protein FliR [Alphaproteobacteria bacterium]